MTTKGKRRDFAVYHSGDGHVFKVSNVQKKGGMHEGRLSIRVRGPSITNRTGGTTLYCSPNEESVELVIRDFLEKNSNSPSITISFHEEESDVEISEIVSAAISASKPTGIGVYHTSHIGETGFDELEAALLVLERGGEFTAVDLLTELAQEFFIRKREILPSPTSPQFTVSRLRGLAKNHIRGPPLYISRHPDIGIITGMPDDWNETFQGMFDFDGSEWKLWLDWHNLRNELEHDQSVRFRGTGKGRMYRHKTTRPRLSYRFAGCYLVDILKETEPLNREECWQHLRGRLMATHHFLETGRPCHIELSKDLYQSMSLVHQGGSLEDFKVKVEIDVGELSKTLGRDAEQYSMRENYREGFDQWAIENYTYEWFNSSWSNINREMRQAGAASGSPRGVWTTREKKEAQMEKLEPQGRTTVESLPRIERMIASTKKELYKIRASSLDEASVLSVIIPLLKEVTEGLERELIRLKGDYEN